ncbi:MAG: 23S rRNA (adenine(2030)-N(6))-methyltransferase RlmJ, partial [Alphaproteobacteria bacterium]|nr:23S rRNA (adenine(2030)-N(6))-methyltransferase RlmJ [Alphaproteobacteria bacterium]
MNYRHPFHAGNFADVFKHIFLILILRHLALKETPFRYIDTHAGSGLYELPEPLEGKNAEWQGESANCWRQTRRQRSNPWSRPIWRSKRRSFPN